MLAALASIFVVAGMLVWMVYKPPKFLVDHCSYRWPDVLWHGNTSKPVVALTIDDVPSQHTTKILHILNKNNSAATLFVIGSYVPGFESVLREAVRQGHELANHAMYDEPSHALRSADLASQIEQVDALIESIYVDVGKALPPRYFRPGSGFFNTQMRVLVKRMGHRLVLGDVYPHDPQVPFWRVNAWHILSMVRPGSIIVCHDGRSWTPPMLEMVLPELKRRGYRVVTVTELLSETTMSSSD